MKRILFAAGLIAASPSAYACTEGQREQLNARVERLFEQMNANGSSATGQAYMQTLQAYGQCLAAERAGNKTPLGGEAYASAAARYPLANFPNHPIVHVYVDPLDAMRANCRKLNEDGRDDNLLEQDIGGLKVTCGGRK